MLTLSGANGAAHAEDREERLILNGRARRYLFHVPAHSPSTLSRPLVIVLHGHGGDAHQVERISGMNAVADREGFAVVYPNGTSWDSLPWFSWNAGNCCGYAMNKRIDDVGFLRALIDHLIRTESIDSRRIYATGISNGAMMAYRLACEASDRIAAIAPVAGALAVSSCAPSQPVSVIIFHGTEDAYIPYAGGQGRAVSDRRTDRSVASTVAFWVAQDGCALVPERKVYGHIQQEIYRSGTNGAEVVLYTIRDGAHAWPGGKPGWWLGAQPTKALSATEEMWAFFVRHPKSPPSSSRKW